MEKLLARLAHQLDSLDEASLMALWSKYATLTTRFEPTSQWEEACLIFALIQAKHWKNQLFNYCWLQQRKPPIKETEDYEVLGVEFGMDTPESPQPPPGGCRILQFPDPAQKDHA